MALTALAGLLSSHAVLSFEGAENRSTPSALASAGTPAPPTIPGDVVADFSDVRQPIDGFGASDRKNPLLTDAEADLFFSVSRGIGLSMLRASIDPTGAYFGGNYANATKAAARGAVVWATPWSPPAAWKDNGDVNNGGHLLPADYDAWASRLANFASLLQQNAGVPLYGVSVQNEPDYAAGYNSAIYSPQQMVDFIKVLGPKLAALTPRPKLITPDVASWAVLWNYSDAIMSDPVAASYTDILATHQYFAPSPSAHAIPPGKTLWETEMSSFDGAATDIGNGITVAKWIHGALVDASVSAWHYWWLIGQGGDNEGLLNIGDEPTKRLYTMGNFSKFIRPGFVRVGTAGGPSSVYLSAYKDPATDAVAIVAINDSGSSVPLGVELNGTSAVIVTPWVTSATEGLAPHAPIAVSAGRFTMTLAASSVTTFVSGNPVPPVIASVSPNSGAAGTSVTITGTNFGSTQGTSTIQFNGAAATPTSWSATSVVAPAPIDATTGPVVVTVNGVASNGVAFTSPTAAGASVFDTFTGADGTALASHLPNVGGAWIDDVAGNRILSNRLEGVNFGGGRSHNATRPASADYEVSVDVTMNVTGWGNKAGVQGRVQTDLGGIGNSRYEAYFSEANRTWYLDKWIGGNPTTLGSFADAAFTSGTKTLKFGLVGTTLTVYVNGTSVIRVTDASVTAAGYPGIYNQGGIHNGILLDNYLVADGGAMTPQPPGVPTSPNPANASTGVSATPTLTWSATGASTFDVRFGTTTLPPLIATAASASYGPATLAAGTTYYWQIIANNSAGTTTGPVWSFATAAAPPPPSVTSLSPASGGAGTAVTISGASFGATQGTSSVRFNGTVATPTSWSAGSIVAPVPGGATTGTVVVTVNGVASNGAPFTVTDTQAPTAPGALTATAASSSRIDLAWTASTDNVGVTSYLIERCQGAGCTTFAQIATTSSTTLSDAGLTAATGYSYRVRATDAANNLSPYSNTASATTQAATVTPITFVQANYASPSTTQATVTVPFLSAQRAGDVNVVVVGWNDAVRQVQAVTDTQGNAYVLAVGPTVSAGVASQAMFYAANVAAATAGANTVTVTFTSAATSPSVRIVEYAGANTATPLDGTAAAQGTTATSDSGPATTTAASGMLVAANLVQTGTATGAGFTLRLGGGVAYARDSFTAANGTALGAHAPETGGTWIDDQPAMTIQGNRIEATNFGDGRAHNAATPASANYDVQVDVTLAVPGWGNKAGVRGRDAGGRLGDAYEASFNESARTWTLDKWIGFNVTTLGTYADPGFTSGTKTVTLRMIGSSIQVLVDGTVRIAVTDTAITATNHPGLRSSGGIHNGLPLSNYLVRDASGATPFLLEDRAVSAAGTYNATAAVSPASPWIMQLIVLR